MSGNEIHPPAAASSISDRMDILRKSIDQRFTRFELVWLLSEALLGAAINGPEASIVDGLDKAEAELIERAKGLKEIQRLVARNRRAQRFLARMDAFLTRAEQGQVGKPKHRHKRKAVR